MTAPADVWNASSYGSPIYSKPGPVLASTTVSSLMINVSGLPTGEIIPIFSGDGGETDGRAVLYDNAPWIPDNHKVLLYSVKCANANPGTSDGNCIQFHVISSGTGGSGIDFTVQANGNGGYEVMQVFDDTSYATGVGGGIGLTRLIRADNIINS